MCAASDMMATLQEQRGHHGQTFDGALRAYISDAMEHCKLLLLQVLL
jgi:hypothetical protein